LLHFRAVCPCCMSISVLHVLLHILPSACPCCISLKCMFMPFFKTVSKYFTPF
jgi:hypothetical protein